MRYRYEKEINKNVSVDKIILEEPTDKHIIYSIRMFFFKPYVIQGLIYLQINKPTIEITNTVKWLKKVMVITTSKKRANKIAFEYFNEQNPIYKHFIHLLYINKV